MGCPCSAILNSVGKTKAASKIERNQNNQEIVKLRNYIQNHPDKDNIKFKRSMVVILLYILRTLN